MQNPIRESSASFEKKSAKNAPTNQQKKSSAKMEVIMKSSIKKILFYFIIFMAGTALCA